MQAVRHHRQCAVELFLHDVHGRMRVGVDENHVFEEIAVEHGFDGDVADDDGRNGKQNQRQGNDQRAFVRIVVLPCRDVLRHGRLNGVRAGCAIFFAVEHRKVLAERVNAVTNTLARTAK